MKAKKVMMWTNAYQLYGKDSISFFALKCSKKYAKTQLNDLIRVEITPTQPRRKVK